MRTRVIKDEMIRVDQDDDDDDVGFILSTSVPIPVCIAALFCRRTFVGMVNIKLALAERERVISTYIRTYTGLHA